MPRRSDRFIEFLARTAALLVEMPWDGELFPRKCQTAAGRAGQWRRPSVSRPALPPIGQESRGGTEAAASHSRAASTKTGERCPARRNRGDGSRGNDTTTTRATFTKMLWLMSYRSCPQPGSGRSGALASTAHAAMKATLGQACHADGTASTPIAAPVMLWPIGVTGAL
jgi:hypothetical protein